MSHVATIGTVQPKHLVGYARVSTDDQNLTLQLDALTRHGISKSDIFTDKQSGAKSGRPGLTKCLEALQEGDILVVWRLDRLGRSMRQLITLIEDVRERGVGFRSLNEGAIDTTSASGELIFNIFSALAQFERRLIQERTKAGLAAARAGGRNGGRPKLIADEAKVVLAQQLHRDHSLSIDDICKTLRISRSTYYRYVRLRDSPSSQGGENIGPPRDRRPSAPIFRRCAYRLCRHESRCPLVPISANRLDRLWQPFHGCLGTSIQTMVSNPPVQARS